MALAEQETVTFWPIRTSRIDLEVMEIECRQYFRRRK
jgi:hypothetical protein